VNVSDRFGREGSQRRDLGYCAKWRAYDPVVSSGQIVDYEAAFSFHCQCALYEGLPLTWRGMLDVKA